MWKEKRKKKYAFDIFLDKLLYICMEKWKIWAWMNLGGILQNFE